MLPLSNVTAVSGVHYFFDYFSVIRAFRNRIFLQAFPAK